MDKPPPSLKDRRTNSPDQPSVPFERRSGRDRRVHHRVAVNWAVDYRANDTFLFAYISDLSCMGIFVQTPTPAKTGARLSLRFSPPGGPTLDMAGEVIWVNPPRPGETEKHQPGMGIQFVELSETRKAALMRLVKTFAYLPDEQEILTDC